MWSEAAGWVFRVEVVDPMALSDGTRNADGSLLAAAELVAKRRKESNL
jgi:hypothetical protein